MGVVVKDTENLWIEEFQQHNMTYQPPKVVLFTDATQSACGTAQSASGPFYCPNDKKVYIDLAFYDQLRNQFGAPGDFAQAYVIAHEIGHAVQDQTGVLPEFNQRRASMSQDEQNAYSVRVELQADCYAGVWANYANRQNYLEQGDVEEAINAANADRRRYADARAGGAAQLHARHLGAAHAVAEARHADRRRRQVRHVQRLDLAEARRRGARSSREVCDGSSCRAD